VVVALFEVLCQRRSRSEEGSITAEVTTITAIKSTKQDETELAVRFPDNHNIYFNSVQCLSF
jgi:hypothetical protein